MTIVLNRVPRLDLGAIRRVPEDRRLVAVLLLAVGTVQGWNVLRFPALSDDEGTYLAQAWAVRNGAGLAHYTYWYDHPPLGWIQIAALSWLPAALLPGQLAVAAGRIGMLAVSLTSAVLVYVVARRLALPRSAAAFAVLLFGLSPLAVTMQRQIYLDNVAVCWMLGAFALALSPRKHMWHHVAAGVCAAVSALSKETVILTLPGLLVALWRGSDPTTRTFSLAGFCSGLGLVAACYPLYAALNRELLPGPGHVSLVGALFFQVHGRAGSGNVFTPGSGANQLLQAWLYYDPVLPVVGSVAVAIGVAVRQVRAPALGGLALVLVALRPGGYLPAMYVVQTLPFFALTIAGLVAVAVSAARRAAPRALVAAVAVAGLLAAAGTLPFWYVGDRRAMTEDANREYAQAVAWVRQYVPDLPHARIVTDDAIWLDLVQAGCRPGLGAIWFYKVDLDPAVQRTLPHGWRDVDYVISTPIIRQDPNGLPTVLDVLAHSTVRITFGTGDGRIEIRRVEKG